MFEYEPIIQNITLETGFSPDVLRLDLLHHEVSGNKWFKLRYNIEEMRFIGCEGILTFGGQHSNHIAATAAAGKLLGFKTAAVLRGERSGALSPTLEEAENAGMHLNFVPRAEYKNPSSQSGRCTIPGFENYFVVPEGGANDLGIRGASGILENVADYDIIMCACGTGTTFAGLQKAAGDKSIIIGMSVLKGVNTLLKDLLEKTGVSFSEEIAGNEILLEDTINRSALINSYAGRGYASCEEHLENFKKDVFVKTGLVLDHVYTVKLFYAALDLFRKGLLAKNKRILLIHSGGLQGNQAFEKRFGII